VPITLIPIIKRKTKGTVSPSFATTGRTVPLVFFVMVLSDFCLILGVYFFIIYLQRRKETYLLYFSATNFAFVIATPIP
jgi:hypothetical protein